jgi:hypothetical protein
MSHQTTLRRLCSLWWRVRWLPYHPSANSSPSKNSHAASTSKSIYTAEVHARCVEISESSVVTRGVVCIGHANRPQHYVRLLLHSFRFSISKCDECIALWKSVHSEHVFEVDVDSAGPRAGPCAPRPCCHLTPSMLTSARDSTIVRFPVD